MKVLVNNFFYGILDRGIPIYTRNLVQTLELCGVEVKEVQCPKSILKMPRALLNVCFVLFEQFIIPLLSIRYDLLVNPYNSASLLVFPSSKQLLIIHDFIPNNTKTFSFAASYICITQRIAALNGADVAVVSKATMDAAKTMEPFKNLTINYLPNAFADFMKLAADVQSYDGKYVLLCTGIGKNKDLLGAICLWLSLDFHKSVQLRVLGLQGNVDIENRIFEKYPLIKSSTVVLPRLTDLEVVNEYAGAKYVWVHSNHEGYGRSIAEAKFLGKPVVASDIPPFREQSASAVFFYHDIDSFSLANANASNIVNTDFPIKNCANSESLFDNLKKYIDEKRSNSYNT